MMAEALLCADALKTTISLSPLFDIVVDLVTCRCLFLVVSVRLLRAKVHSGAISSRTARHLALLGKC